MEQKKPKKPLDYLNDLPVKNPANIVIASVAVLAAVFALGHIFKISAGAIRGYNELRRALKGN